MTSLTSLPFIVHYRFLYIFEPILFLPFRPAVPYQGWQQPMVTYEGYLVYINRTKLRPRTVFLMTARHYRTFEETECPGIAATASIVSHNTISSKTHLSLVVQQLPTPRCEARQAAESSGNLEVISLSAVISHRNPCKVRPREVDVAGWCHSRSWARSWGPERWNTAVRRHGSNRYYEFARSESVAVTLSNDC